MSSRALALAAATLSLAVAPSLADAGNGTKLTRFLSEDTKMVLVLDVAGARDSDLFKQGVDFLVSKADADGVAKLRNAGIDPIKDVDTILLAGGSADAGAELDKLGDKVMILEGRFDAKKLGALATNAVEKKSKAGVAYWESKDTAAALIDGRLFITDAVRIEAVITQARAKKGKAPSVASSKKAARLRAVIASTDTRHDAWCAALLPPDASAKMSSLGTAVDAMSFAVAFGVGLDGEVHVHTANEAGATAMITQMQPFLGQANSSLGTIGLSGFAKSLVIDHTGPVVELRFAMSAAEISTMVGMLGSFAP